MINLSKNEENIITIPRIVGLDSSLTWFLLEFVDESQLTSAFLSVQDSSTKPSYNTFVFTEGTDVTIAIGQGTLKIYQTATSTTDNTGLTPITECQYEILGDSEDGVSIDYAVFGSGALGEVEGTQFRTFEEDEVVDTTDTRSIPEQFILLNYDNDEELESGLKVDLGDGTFSELVRRPSDNTWIIREGETEIIIGAITSPAGSDGQVQFNNSGDFGASANLFWDNTNNRLGIGATTPLRKLHITDDGVDNTARVYIEATPGLSGPALEMAFDASATKRALIRANEVGDDGTSISFFTTPQSGGVMQRMVVDDDGNVGIGIANPGTMLDMNGRLRFRAVNTSAPTSGRGMEFFYNTNVEQALLIAVDRDTTNDNLLTQRFVGNPIRFDTGTSLANDAERMRIDSNGNVGIGITEPTESLHTSGNILIENDTNQSPNAQGDGHFKIEGAGYSGFMTLDLTAMYVGHNSGTRGLSLMTNETSRIFISGTGNVGIGNNNPQQNLDVTGNIAASGTISVPNLSEYTDNQAAIDAGLTVGDIYRTGGDLKVVI